MSLLALGSVPPVVRACGESQLPGIQLVWWGAGVRAAAMQSTAEQQGLHCSGQEQEYSFPLKTILEVALSKRGGCGCMLSRPLVNDSLLFLQIRGELNDFM